MHQSNVVQHDLRWECVHPEEVVGEGLLRHMEVSFGADDVGPPRGCAATLHPRRPQLDAAVV